MTLPIRSWMLVLRTHSRGRADLVALMMDTRLIDTSESLLAKLSVNRALHGPLWKRARGSITNVDLVVRKSPDGLSDQSGILLSGRAK